MHAVELDLRNTARADVGSRLPFLLMMSISRATSLSVAMDLLRAFDSVVAEAESQTAAGFP
jgi:hypothetical protein